MKMCSFGSGAMCVYVCYLDRELCIWALKSTDVFLLFRHWTYITSMKPHRAEDTIITYRLAS